MILFLAYMLSSVFLFGAEVTKAYSDHLDRRESGEPEAPGVRAGRPARRRPCSPFWRASSSGGADPDDDLVSFAPRLQ